MSEVVTSLKTIPGKQVLCDDGDVLLDIGKEKEYTISLSTDEKECLEWLLNWYGKKFSPEGDIYQEILDKLKKL